MRVLCVNEVIEVSGAGGPPSFDFGNFFLLVGGGTLLVGMAIGAGITYCLSR